MKRLIALYLIANISLMGEVAQGYYTYCDIVERNKKVEMNFSKNVRYIDDNYVQILKENMPHTFTNGDSVVMYMATWKWILDHRSIYVGNGVRKWTMWHEIDYEKVNRKVRQNFDYRERRFDIRQIYEYGEYDSH